MQALNFLNEAPVTDWLDFIVHPPGLNTHFRKPSDVPVTTLLNQFLDKAKVEENESLAPALLPEDVEHHTKKSWRLWHLAGACCAGLNWDLTQLKEEIPLDSAQELMDRLILWGWGKEEGCLLQALSPLSPAYLPSSTRLLTILRSLLEQTSDPGDPRFFVVLLYCQWILLASIKCDYARKIEVFDSTSRSGNQQNLTKLSQKLVSMQDTCVSILNEWLCSSKKSDLAAPSPMAFIEDGPLASTSYRSCPDFTNAPIPVKSSTLQCRTRQVLLEFFFWKGPSSVAADHLQALKNLAKANPSEPVDAGLLDGYSRALSPSNQPDPRTPVEAIVLAERRPVENLVNVLGVHGDEIHLSTLMAANRNPQLENIRNVSAGAWALKLVLQHKSLSQQLFFKVLNDESMAFFLTSLQSRLNKVQSKSGLLRFVRYLRLFSATSKKFHEMLGKTGLTAFFGDLSKIFKQIDRQFPLHPPPTSSTTDYDSGGDAYWKFLRSENPVEIKKLLPQLQPVQVPVRIGVPAWLDSVFARMGKQAFLKDYVAVLSMKMSARKRLKAVKATETLSRAVPDLNAPPEVKQILAIEMNYQVLETKLEKWHDMLYQCQELKELDVLGQSLLPVVKESVSSALPLPTNSSLPLLFSSFLINNAEWKFLIESCEKFDSPFMDVAKLLSAFCTQLESKGQALKNVSRTFFEVMRRTLEDSPGSQAKRGAAGERRPVQGMLLSRPQLLSFVARIREQTTLSLLLSFFGKFFNIITPGFQHLFTEHESIWPTTYSSSENINEPFVEEIVEVTLKSALLTNPNNAFFLRARADFENCKSEFKEAMKYYLQTLLVASQGFSVSIPVNVVDEDMYISMRRCCLKLSRPTEYGVFSQFLTDDDDFATIIKSLEGKDALDADTDLYPFVWDSRLLELLIYSLSRHRHLLKQETALTILGAQELNSNNVAEVRASVMERKRKRFLFTMCNQYFTDNL